MTSMLSREQKGINNEKYPKSYTKMRRTNKFTFFASSLLNVGTLSVTEKASQNPIDSKKPSSLVVPITMSFFP